jgi:hypothetical protein
VAAKKKTKPAAKAAKKKPVSKAKDKPAAKPAAPAKPAAKAQAPPAAKAPAKGPAGKAGAAAPARPGGPPAAPAGAAGVRPGAAPAGRAGVPGKGPRPRKPSRRSSLANRRGPGGELFTPGDLLIPNGPQGPDEIQYILRGAVAAEHEAGPVGVSEIITKKGTPEAEGDRPELGRIAEGLSDRFEKGPIEAMLPNRPPQRRNFLGVVERAKHRRREIGAFLRGLDLGRTETSHMDSHGEASLQSLMEWAARLENLAEADEPETADYAQFHRGLDQLDNTTEALIVDVEQTLRRMRDRIRS